ncbi:MAG TPA: fibronectin type III domain-containing protein [Bacteroidia bacterium]|nr:fibronectin type III domain-containing protein [Bacteroidia bacterium]
MIKFVVKLGLSKKSIPQKIDLGKGIDLAMTGNPLFTMVTNPTIVEVKAATTALETAANDVSAAGGGTLLTSIMHEKEELFNVAVTGMGRNVDNIAKGDKTIVLSAGMEASKEREPAQVPLAAANLKAVPGLLPGTADLKWKRPKWALLFNVYSSPDPVTPTSWMLKGQTTKSRFTVTELEPLKNHWFRVEPVGTAGTGPLSDPATSAAL